MIKIAIDTLGNDKGPEVIVEGAVMALQANDDLSVVLYGDQAVIEAKLAELTYDAARLEVVHAPDAVTNYDNPMQAIFQKPDASIVKGLQELGKREDLFGLVSAGSTGALIAGALRFVPAKQLKRPALAAILPAAKGGYTCLVDTGANIDCTASQLVDFAHMGSDLMKQYYNVENPRVGLLSNGAEETKGNKLVKETHQLLKVEEGLNFVGNIEGTNALSGDCDVLVAEGFAGNQVLKNSEGIARRIITDVVVYGKKTGNPEIMKLVQYLLGVYDFNALGGAILLGVGKPVVKARGSANADSIKNTSEILLNMAQNRDIFYGKDIR
ncbi:MAG: phosphate acyltransferase PlsX [Clostridia bacterium]|nr:phosphate acyltransferase PlsX [Clostridia bacterium]MBR5880431.1 phosphate acyltransferase PlsX [Clostridia bacterium]